MFGCQSVYFVIIGLVLDKYIGNNFGRSKRFCLCMKQNPCKRKRNMKILIAEKDEASAMDTSELYSTQ